MGMRTQHYPSDVTDEQWLLVEPFIPVYPGGRPRKTSTRDVLDAIFYLLRTGCPWRVLPKDFPPKSTTWRYFNEGRHNGTLEERRGVSVNGVGLRSTPRSRPVVRRPRRRQFWLRSPTAKRLHFL